MNKIAHIQQWWRTTLSRQIVIPTLLVTLVFLSGMGVASFFFVKQSLINQTNLHNVQIATIVAQDVVSYFDIIIKSTQLQENQLGNFQMPLQQRMALENLRVHLPKAYNDILLLNDKGQKVFALTDTDKQDQVYEVQHFSPPETIPLTPDITEALQKHTMHMSDVAFRQMRRLPFITALIPLTQNDQMTGALVVQMDLRVFWTKLGSVPIEHGGVSIFDENGLIIAHTNPQRVGESIDQALIAPVFDGYENVINYSRDGIEYFAAYSLVHSSVNWGVLVEQEQHAALAPLDMVRNIALLMTVCMAVIVAFLQWVIIHHMVQPLALLSKTAGNIASSDNVLHDLHTVDEDLRIWETTHMVNINMHVRSTNEIYVLTTSFQHMINVLHQAHDRLQQWNATLEQRVDERTRELQTILEVARLSGLSLQQEEILSTLMKQIKRLVAFDSATIMLLDESRTMLETTVTSHHKIDLSLQHTYPLNEFPLNETVIMTGKPVIVANTALEPRWHHSASSQHNLPLSWLGVPLIVNEVPIGVFGLIKKEPAYYTDENATLLAALANQVAVTLAHARLYKESVRRFQQELAMAEQIQRHLFPTTLPTIPGITAATFYRPARETTGDFYEFVLNTPTTHDRQISDGDGVVSVDATHAQHTTVADNTLGIIIGDVSGKSLPAAMLMVMARTALRSAAFDNLTSPAIVLERANATLFGDIPQGSFVASTYATICCPGGQQVQPAPVHNGKSNGHHHHNQATMPTHNCCSYSITLCNAAQPAPLLIRNHTAMTLEGRGNHFPLGIINDLSYEAEYIALQPGDLLVFYTDGVIEAHNEHNELFGFERLEDILTGCPAHMLPQEVIEMVMDAVTTWAGTMSQHDDIALVVVRLS